MKSLGREQDYDWDPPAPIAQRVDFTTYVGAKYILEHSEIFKVTSGEATAWLFGKAGWDFMLSGDSPFHAKQKDLMRKSLYRENWHREIKDFYEFITLKLLHQHSCKIAGVNQVDITRE